MEWISEIKTVRDMGWLGMKNGELLELISINGFELFVTLDKNQRHQQNLKNYKFSVFILLSVNKRRETLQNLVEKIKDKIKTGSPRRINVIS